MPSEYRVITSEERLEAIAEDIVSHFMGRGHRGKAMVISIDKATAVKMYDKVKQHWKCYRERLESELRDAPDRDRETLEADIQFMKQTDMAVVVSPAPNEIADLEARGVDITPHRQRMNAQDLDAKFKRLRRPIPHRFRLRHVDDRIRCASLFDDLSGQATAGPYLNANNR